MVLTWALQLGLTATVLLLRGRVRGKTLHLYEGGKERKGAKKLWEEAREEYLQSKKEGRPSAIFMQKAEKNIRRIYIIFILTSAVAYGNEEEKRKRRKEDRKYINMLLDYLGARLRDVGAAYFKFTPPLKRVLENEKVVRVYPGTAKIPEYQPSHTVPELDLMDMTRSHCIELVRQCLKYNVPKKDAQAYIDELIDRLLPYLEWVYTGRKRGKSGFLKEGMRELRIVVEKIRVQYGTFNGRTQSVTGAIREREETENKDPLVPQGHEVYDDQVPLEDHSFEIDDADLTEIPIEERNTFATYWKDLLGRSPVDIYPKGKECTARVKEFAGIPNDEDDNQVIDKKKIYLTERDVKHLYEILREESRRIGVALHDFVANSDCTLRPFNLFSIIRYGDTLLTQPSEWALVSEVAVANGTGRIDLILFRRKVILFADGRHPSSVWEPCMIIEVKTKSAFNIDLYAVPTRSKKDSRRRVVHFDHERRKLTEDKWKAIISSTPRKETKDQLEAYEKLLISEYERIGRIDHSPPKDIMKAVLVVDSRENWELVRDNLQDLLVESYEECKGQELKGRELFQLRDEQRSAHASLVVFDNTSVDVETARPVHVQRFDPFRHSQDRDDTRKFTLYFPVAGKGSSQKSASHIAANWHGFQYIYEQSKTTGQKVIWLDFTGEYADLSLRKKRLYLTLYPKPLQRFIKWGIKFINLSQLILQFLGHDITLDSFIKSIRGRTQKNSIIVVTGLDTVRDKTPPHSVSYLEEVVLHLIENVPEKTSIIWFDRPVPLSQTSQRYDTRCVAPFYQRSPWMYYVDEIIWNNPMSPRRYGSYFPPDDDIRVIAIERPEKPLTTELITVPPLFKWGERFRADKDRDENIDSRTMFFLKGSYPSIGQQNLRQYDKSDIDATLELIPHLLDYSQDETNPKPSIHRETLPMEISDPPLFLSMTSFTPYQTKARKEPPTQKSRRGEPRLELLKNINHRRRYRRTLLNGTPPKLSTRPPHLGLLKYEHISEEEMVRKELNGLRATIRLLKSRDGRQLKGFLSILSGILDPKEIRKKKGRELFNVLREVTQLLENYSKTSRVWKALRPLRLKNPNGLTPHSSDEMHRLSRKYPGILLLTGNQFFLLLLAALDQNNSSRPSTGLLERLWTYILPWQLTILGFTPHYHAQHRTGKSVLNRGRLLDTMTRKVREMGEIIQKGGPSEVLFGQVIPVTLKKEDYLSALWLVFQSKPGNTEMNASLVPLSRVKTLDISTILQDLLRDQPYWGETDLTKLRVMAEQADTSTGVPIMVATYQGVRGLWMYDPSKLAWLAIGRFDYWTRAKEDVTLLQSYTLRNDASLQTIKASQVREVPRDLEHNIKQGLRLVERSYEDIKTAKCSVSLDKESGMYNLEFSDDAAVIGKLVVKRTSDVIELLRRPSIECEPVEIEGEKLVWNRFDDDAIKYDVETEVLRPWVQRRDPFPITELKVPSTAEELAGARRKSGLGLRITHERGVCPKRESINERTFRDEREREEYLKDIEGLPGQPDTLPFETIKGHGACWRVTPEYIELPEEVTRLNEIMLTGPALAALLKTRAMVYQSGEDWVIHEFHIPNRDALPDEFEESYSFRKTYYQLVSKALEEQKRTGIRPPEMEELWKIHLTWDLGYFIWSAESDITRQLFQRNTFTVQLYEKASLEVNYDLVMESITTLIPEEKIKDIEDLQDQIRSTLRGSFKTELVCEGDVLQRDDEVQVRLWVPGNAALDSRIPLDIEEGMTVNEVWDAFLQEMEEGNFAGYSIKQEARVKAQLKRTMKSLAKEQGWQSKVIDERREEAVSSWDIGGIATQCSIESDKVSSLKEEGSFEEALDLIEKNVKKLEDLPRSGFWAEPISNTILMLLLDKVTILTDPEYPGSVSKALLKMDLNRIEELSQEMGKKAVISSKTDFMKKLRKALDLLEWLNEEI